ncbi:MAG: M28 family peptidase [Flavobacteriales bacterium]|nr:M28 family peptidase [Flavobacteriales bacterium]
MFSRYLSLVVLLIAPFVGWSQDSILLTNPIAEQILLSNYNPADYSASTTIDYADDIVCDLASEISADSLMNYLVRLNTFQNRNSGSDTVSATTGIGAARRWAISKFDEFSAASENRLVTTYLQWDEDICGMPQHRNVIAILPGSDLSDSSIIIIEGHIDSRCEGSCDVLCDAPGMEDNGSGTVLVLELARAMSKYTFPNTIVFMLTIGEEQGLIGANAFAQYVFDNNIQVKAVQNNDVIGGILCGETSSGPSCPFEGHIDSTNVRIFSDKSLVNQQSRSYARFAKLVNDEKLVPIAAVPMTINIINQTDRTGRGGDHIPFSNRLYTAIRYCAANEHGDANVAAPGYNDRQHTGADELGVDTDSDGKLDSFFVDVNYLKRNAIQNAATAAMASLGPEVPEYTLVNDSTGMTIHITSGKQHLNYRVGINTQSQSTEFLGLYRFSDTVFAIPGLDVTESYFVSLAAIDSNGITSLFSKASFPPITPLVNSPTAAQDDLPYGVTCLLNGVKEERNDNKLKVAMSSVPNPSNGMTRILFSLASDADSKEAVVVIHNINGQQVFKKYVVLSNSTNEVLFDGSRYSSGVYTYGIVVDGKVVRSEKLTLVK